MIRRLLYLGYYFRELDTGKLRSFMNYVSESQGISKPALWFDIVRSSLRYNISILEYFQFQFYRIPPSEKESFAGTGYMYEYQLAMNPKTSRVVLENKIQFLKVYKDFVRHDFATLADLEKDESLAKRILSNPSGKVVLKSSAGQCGMGIEVRNTEGLTYETLLERLRATSNDYVEEYVVQHPELMKLSPSGLNTVRIITQLNAADEVDIIGVRLRITINAAVDNLAAGNMAAPVNSVTGIVEGPGVFSDITKGEQLNHPVTYVRLPGFQIPFWEDTVKMVRAAALKNKGNRSIGWDVAITTRGPELIEGNHDWCKLLWQLPVKKGLKPVLESYIREKKRL